MSTPPNLLQSLINAAEKASNIARICRSNIQLLSLLVQEKMGAEANIRFQHDFKTLADVLIQETIKHDIGKLYPKMLEAIKGEESPTFTNQNGSTVSIKVGETQTSTSQCLSEIIQNAEYQEAVQILASEVHRDVQYSGDELGIIPQLPSNINYRNLGIWIDPIDATAEYICGESKPSNIPGIAASGLDCVTVLIGVYEISSGMPVMGIISQPFHKKTETNSYRSHIFWGVALLELKANNCSHFSTSRSKPLAICSSTERPNFLEKLHNENFETVFSAGAGHKALKVITNDADLYLISKDSTFKWDTCAPQAILRSLNGNMFNFVESMKQKVLVNLEYLEKSESGDDGGKCNRGGIIAVRDLNIIRNLLL